MFGLNTRAGFGVGLGIAAAFCSLALPSLGCCAAYGYDSTGRLTSVLASNGNLVTYTYDAAGNRISVGVSAQALNILQTQTGVIASAPIGYYSTNVPSNAFVLDSARFIANPTSTDGAQLLKYDFGSSKWIGTVELDAAYWPDSATGVAKLGIYGSNDNSTWTQLTSYNLIGLASSNYGPAYVGASYRYVAVQTMDVTTSASFNVDLFQVMGH